MVVWRFDESIILVNSHAFVSIKISGLWLGNTSLDQLRYAFGAENVYNLYIHIEI